jgi:hypothetical protein
MIEILKRSAKDFLSRRFLIMSFAPLIVALIVLGVLIFLGAGELIDALNIWLDDPQLGVSYPMLAKLMSFAFVHYIIAIFVYFFGLFLVLFFSLVIGVITLGFLTPVVTRTLHAQYYSHLPLVQMNFASSLGGMGLIILKALGILILCVPFMFVPALNLIAFNAPFFYLFYSLLIFDVRSNICSKRDFIAAIKGRKMDLFLAVLAFYFCALIPVIGLFLQLFFAIYLTHFTFYCLNK